MEPNPHVVIIGPGSMGLTHAALLARAGADVTVLDYRPQRAAELSASGISIRGAAGDFAVKVPVTAVASQLRPPNLAVFFVKAYSTAAALRHAQEALQEPTILLTLQNGLGNYELLVEFAGAHRVVAGTTSSAAYRTGAAEVHVAAIGDIQIGGAGAAAQVAHQVCELFSSAELPAAVCDDPQAMLWRKAIVNAGINPLAALAGVRNGALLQVPALRLLLGGLVREAQEIARVAGIGLDENMVAVAEQVAAHTAQNRCSMLQDLRAGRRTEIEQISGHLAAVGYEHNAPAYLNQTLVSMVKAAAAMKGSRPL